MGNNFYKQINIFIINPQDINGICDLFPKYISKNKLYDEKYFKEKTFNWKAVLFKSTNLDTILNKTEEKILEIKQKDKIQNNIIIAQNVLTNPLFKKIKEINKKLDTKKQRA